MSLNIFKVSTKLGLLFLRYGGLGYRSGYGTTLHVGRTRDRFQAVTLGIYSAAADIPVCPGSTQPLKMSTRIFLGVKAAGA